MSSLLGPGYDSSDDDDPSNVSTAATHVVAAPDAAPEVDTEVWSLALVQPEAQ